MTKNEMVASAVAWMLALPVDKQKAALAELFEFAVDAEWIRVRDKADCEWLAKEDGGAPEDYAAPYITTCGEPLGSQYD